MLHPALFAVLLALFRPDGTLLPPPSAPRAVLAADHAAWDSLLLRYVSPAGKVNYAALKKNDAPALEAYCRHLGEHPPQDTWSRAEQMAYWINAYNAFTVRLIVEHYPTSSIMRLDGGKTWDVKRIPIGSKKYSLNQIENDMLRARFKDARIHFALNCAARSCPPLLHRAYSPGQLDSLLDARTRSFIRDGGHNTISGDRAEVSKIFEWYAADFGDLRSYLNRYAKVSMKRGAAITYREYDWNLND
ncbi:MAG TPA: DUF547 domain-containing protein [Saprospiraceae bacterium]|nr:DUF547 domain-containing protein [Saprospiraceae bacterium]HNG88968.1 DUF547 domain-containing protein [Saprospiraceae bacterium]